MTPAEVEKMMKQTTPRQRLANAMRKAGWNRAVHDDRITGRVYRLASGNHWWDWGTHLTILTGTSFGGNYQEPKPPTWWYVAAPSARMWRTGYPRRRYRIVTDYNEMRRLTEGLDEDGMYNWRAIGYDQNHDLIFGRRYWGGTFHSLDYAEERIVRQYLRTAHRHNWWGLRSWLYAQGLHASVYRRRPFACNQPPPPGAGGYSHWLCTKRRRHAGLHQHNRITWGEIGGFPIGVSSTGDEHQ